MNQGSALLKELDPVDVGMLRDKENTLNTLLRFFQLLVCATTIGLAAVIVNQFQREGLEFRYADLALATGVIGTIWCLVAIVAVRFWPWPMYLVSVPMDFIMIGLWTGTLATMVRYVGPHRCRNVIYSNIIPAIACRCGKVIIGTATFMVLLSAFSLIWSIGMLFHRRPNRKPRFEQVTRAPS